MATLTEIRNAIKDALDLKDFNAYAVEPPAPKYPAAWCFPVGASYHQTFNDAVSWNLRVTVAVAASDVGRAQSNLDAYIAPTGDRSIKALLEADPSLGRKVDSLSVKGIVGYGAQEIAGASVVFAQLEVEVYA
jgi:hypothetical protein